MRPRFVAGNWKMCTTTASARQLATALVESAGQEERVVVGVMPPFPYLAVVGECLRGSRIHLGAQNVYPEQEGAFTGEVGLGMLKDLGCSHVILGHSERRHVLGESDAFIHRKVKAALGTGLYVIFCVGETLAQREANETEAVIARQVQAGLADVDAAAVARLAIAYEPVWAIGTGRNAMPEQAQQVHAFVRRQFAERFGNAAADALAIGYGGSVKPENAASLLAQPDVDGVLVGGASLKADQFLAIVKAAVR